MLNSSSWLWSIVLGASIIMSRLELFFGKAMTSRMLSRPSQNRHETIETESQTAVRRCAIFEGVHKEAELISRFIFRQTEQTEHVILQPESCMRIDPPPSSFPLTTMS